MTKDPKIYVHVYFTPRVLSSSVQDGIYALGKGHMRATPSVMSCFPNVAFETVQDGIYALEKLSPYALRLSGGSTMLPLKQFQ